MSCPFCFPEKDREQRIVLSNKYCFFVQKPQEVLIGSGLIVPKMHRETAFELTPKEWQATFDLLKQVKELLDKEYAPQGYNLGWNCGHAGGQEYFTLICM